MIILMQGRTTMKKRKNLILTTFFYLKFGLVLLSQNVNSNHNEFLDSRLTENHIEIPETDLAIILPEGFFYDRITKTFINNDASISTLILRNQEIQPFLDNLTQHNIDSLELTISRYNKFRESNMRALLISGKRDVYQTVLTLWNDSLLIALKGEAPTKDTIMQKKIQQTIYSVQYQPLTLENAMEKASFELDLSQTNLVLVKFDVSRNPIFFEKKDDLSFVFESSLRDSSSLAESASLRILEIRRDNFDQIIRFNDDYYVSENQDSPALELGQFRINKMKGYYRLVAQEVEDRINYYYVFQLYEKDKCISLRLYISDLKSQYTKSILNAIRNISLK